MSASKLREIIPGTKETRLEHLSNAVSISFLMKEPLRFDLSHIEMKALLNEIESGDKEITNLTALLQRAEEALGWIAAQDDNVKMRNIALNCVKEIRKARE